MGQSVGGGGEEALSEVLHSIRQYAQVTHILYVRNIFIPRPPAQTLSHRRGEKMGLFSTAARRSLGRRPGYKVTYT